MEANIILFKCSRQSKYYGVRVQKVNDDWVRTWAFKISEKNAKKEGYDQQPIRGNLYATDEYPGCPYCGLKSFVQCNACNKISCWNGESSLQCVWCGNQMSNIVTATDEFDVDGGDF